MMILIFNVKWCKWRTLHWTLHWTLHPNPLVYRISASLVWRSRRRRVVSCEEGYCFRRYRLLLPPLGGPRPSGDRRLRPRPRQRPRPRPTTAMMLRIHEIDGIHRLEHSHRLPRHRHRHLHCYLCMNDKTVKSFLFVIKHNLVALVS